MGTIESLIAWGLTTLGSAFIGSYLASYLKKKGENLATHEDLDKLVEQVRAVTTTTKEIEAKISTDVWDRQKRWEMKREVLFEAAKRLGSVQDALGNLDTTYVAARANQSVDWTKEKIDANNKWFDALRKFTETCLLTGVACGNDVKSTCNEFRDFMVPIAAQIFKEDAAIYAGSRPELRKKSRAVVEAIRKELDTDKGT